VNADGNRDIADAVYLLWYLFTDGPEPVAIETEPCDPGTIPPVNCPTEGRFIDNGDGTVTDTCTGLMWQKQTADITGDHEVHDDDFTSWWNAVAYCESLEFAGHDNWRLPTLIELLSIVDWTRFRPAINPIFLSTSEFYWSSTSVGTTNDYALGVSFEFGQLDESEKIAERWGGMVRAVRTAQPPRCGASRLPATGQTTTVATGDDGAYQTGCPMEGRFVDNGDGTVTDNCTGLMWQQETADMNGDEVITPWDPNTGSPDATNWQQALQYCEGLTLGEDGYADWRLPNIRELQSIVDYGRATPATDPVFSTEPAYYWSSSTIVSDSSSAWYVNFSVGNVDAHRRKTLPGYVRAVRTIQPDE